MDNDFNKQHRHLLIIVIITFILPPVIVGGTLMVNATFTYHDFLTNVLIAWQFPVCTGFFFVGTPLYINYLLKRVKRLLIAQKYYKIHAYYKKIIFSYVGLGLAYSLAAVLIPRMLGYPIRISILSATIGMLFVGTASLPFYLYFISKLDQMLEGVPFDRKSRFSVQFKFRWTAIFSSVSGIGIIAVSAGILMWRLLYYPAWELTIEAVYYRLGGLSLFIIGLQIIPNLFLGASFTNNIARIRSFAERMANHDLTQKIKITDRDEFGMAAEEITKMGNNFREIIGQIRANASYLKNASQELKNLATLMSDSSSNQAASAEELASSMEEMSANIAISSENANNSAQISKTTSEHIKLGQDSMVTTIKNIKAITDKVELVQQIASQTNLLAVNASIEAAAAGQYGKGFAVIAREVRELADRSKLTATNISELANATNNNSSELKEKIDDIASKSAENANMAANIATASREQQNSSDQINATVQNLNDNAQRLAASAEELSASAQELSSKANILEHTVVTFAV